MTQVAVLGSASTKIDVSIIMPCLDEARCLPNCIANAREALETMSREFGLSGEIVIADNGSRDGSQLIARALGARVVDVEQLGYGAALIAGLRCANGAYLVMGDADGSYDFRESVEMVRRLAAGADLCVGSRFKGRIERGAMPWKNRHIGNPALTFVLNLFFRAGVSDAHCGLRALTSSCFERLDLTGRGMEFASEMIIKAALKQQHIVEVPVTLSRDRRDRPSHLRPWRDGWRHLRYLLMFSPDWAFAAPAALAIAVSLGILTLTGVAALTENKSPFGNYWMILAGSLLGLGHTAAVLAAATHFYGRRQGFRAPSWWEDKVADWFSLETMLVAGSVFFASGLLILLSVFGYWSSRNFEPIGTVLPAVVGTTLIVIGAQNALAGFLLAIVNGHEANFIDRAEAETWSDTRRRSVRSPIGTCEDVERLDRAAKAADR
ncbi:glycosyltransferase family 2 protein [Methylosinus sporium]|uniref:Glycosyltransferase family 2 protein n=1 Tax=Methylosinus sporium TaxID=428 RepID=A0A549SXJ0_METSR|nr:MULTISPECIES: glycosyltransferase family 2 protein [Methylosinus]MBU3890405.1 glycosyltransferase family 2 protein [Methylosinus sp. KRF6]TRL34326.1 glycosyltransferase family 2 protein [Methylosinus sporium]